MKVLIIDPVHELLITGLKEKGFDVEYFPEITIDEIWKKIPQAEGIIIRSKINIDQKIINYATQLKFIARAGAGMDNVDEFYASKKGITCIHAGGANANAVAEHALGMLLNILHKISHGNKEISNYIFNRNNNNGFELAGTNIGIIGYGHTGKAFADKLRLMGCTVYVYDKYKEINPEEKLIPSNLNQIAEQTTVLSFHVPLTPETKYYGNAEFFNSFRHPFILMNLSRGSVINTKDLIVSLENNKITACALDVLENEKFNTYNPQEISQLKFLTEHPHNILTPHVAGWSVQSFKNISALLLEKITSL